MQNNVSLAELIKNPELRPKDEELTKQSEPLEEPKDRSTITPEESITLNKCTLFSWFISNKDNLIRQDIRVVEIDISGVPKEENIGLTCPTGEVLQDGIKRRKFVTMTEANSYFVIDEPIDRARIFNKGMTFYSQPINGSFRVESYISQTSYLISISCLVDDYWFPYYTLKLNKKDDGVVLVPSVNVDDIRTKLDAPVDFDKLVCAYPQITSIVDKEGVSWLFYMIKLLELKEKIISVQHLSLIDSVIAGCIGLGKL